MGQGLGVALSCGEGRRHGLDPKLLWLWRRPVDPSLEPPYAVGAAMKRQKAKKKGKKVTEAKGTKEKTCEEGSDQWE